jgi:CTP:phosphocholine cytidylyltransferase-like protein
VNTARLVAPKGLLCLTVCWKLVTRGKYRFYFNFIFYLSKFKFIIATVFLMQAIILCAGRGTRMGKLTKLLPKPLLKYKNKNLLIHKLDNLPKKINEIIVVIGYLGKKIKSQIGKTYKHLKIRYVNQKKLNGTCGAVHCAKKLIKDNFMVLMGDDLYSKNDLRKLIDQPPLTMMLNTKKIYTGACLLSTNFFKLKKIKVASSKNEYGIPQTLFFHHKKKQINFITAKKWIRITSPKDLKN